MARLSLPCKSPLQPGKKLARFECHIEAVKSTRAERVPAVNAVDGLKMLKGRERTRVCKTTSRVFRYITSLNKSRVLKKQQICSVFAM